MPRKRLLAVAVSGLRGRPRHGRPDGPPRESRLPRPPRLPRIPDGKFAGLESNASLRRAVFLHYAMKDGLPRAEAERLVESAGMPRVPTRRTPSLPRRPRRRRR